MLYWKSLFSKDADLEALSMLMIKIITRGSLAKSSIEPADQDKFTEMLVAALLNMKKLQRKQYEAFIEGLESLVKSQESTLFAEAFKIITIFKKKQKNYWDVREPLLSFFNSLMSTFALKTKDPARAKEVAKFIEDSKNFAQFISVIMPSFENVYKIDDSKPTGKSMDVASKLDTIKAFCGSINLTKYCKDKATSENFFRYCRAVGLSEESIGYNKNKGIYENFIESCRDHGMSEGSIERYDDRQVSEAFVEFCKDKQISENFVPNIIMLAVAFIQEELDELPESFFKEMNDSMISIRLDEQNLLQNCFKVAQILYNKPDQLYLRLDKFYQSSGFQSDLLDFCKVLTCYTLDDFSTQYPKINVLKNSYFLKLAETIKIEPMNLLGLLDIVFSKDNSENANYFIRTVMKRMRLQEDKFDNIKACMDLFLSQNEAVLLNATKTLNIGYEKFLLVGKRLLDPKFISDSEYRKIGITDSKLKSSIFSAQEEEYEAWKAELRTTIHNKLIAFIEKPPGDNNSNQFDKEGAELVMLYLIDWKSNIFTKNNISSILPSLDTPENKLYRSLTQNGKDSDHNSVDLLASIMPLKLLRLAKGTKYNRFEKEKETAVTTLAASLNVNPDFLRKFVKMFGMKDEKTVMDCFLFFMREEKENINACQRLVSFGLKQVRKSRAQQDFITTELPNFVKLSKEPFRLVSTIFTKYLSDGKSNLETNNFMEMLSYITKKIYYDIDYENAIKLYDEDKLASCCYTASLFTKGLLSKNDIKNHLQVSNPDILKLLSIFSQHDTNRRITQFTSLFKHDHHPVKVALAFYGLVTRQNFLICSYDSSLKVTENEEGANISIKSYLGDIMNVHSELFDLFDLALERDIPKFLEKAHPMIRRLGNTALIDMRLIKSLLPLSLAEHFDTNYFSSILRTQSSYISFFVTISRIALKSTRNKELEELADPSCQTTFKSVLASLKIEPKELIAFARIAFNAFEDDSLLVETIKSLEIKMMTSIDKKSKTEQGLIREHVKGLIVLNSENKVVSLPNLKSAFGKLKRRTEGLFNDLKMAQDEFLMLSATASGNFLMFSKKMEAFNWAFSNANATKSQQDEDVQIDLELRALTMGVSGIINPNVQVTSDLDSKVQRFIEDFDSKQEKFKDPDNDDIDLAQPENSLAYAIYLLRHTLDIAPHWIQRFFFDSKTFENTGADIKKEFVLAIVLNFIHLPDSFMDFIGLYEWDAYLRGFCSRPLDEEAASEKGLLSGQQEFRMQFYTLINFDLGKVAELARANELMHEKDWEELLSSKTGEHTYNRNINSTLVYLIEQARKNKRISIQERIIISSRMFNMSGGVYISPSQLEQPPSEFLGMLIKRLQSARKSVFANRDMSLNELDKLQIGNVVRAVILECYKTLNNSDEELPKADKIDRPNHDFPSESGQSDDVVNIGNAEKVGGFEMTNLCILGTLISLRNSTKEKKRNRKIIYKLHLLATSIERKMYLDQIFYKFSKLKFIKLTGISLGFTIGNVFEWCLPDPLLTFGNIQWLSIFLNAYNRVCEEAT